MKRYSDIGEFYKEKFKDFSPEPSARIWENVQSKVLKPKTPVYKYFIFGTAAFIALTAVLFSVIYFSTNDKNIHHELKETLIPSTHKNAETSVVTDEIPSKKNITKQIENIHTRNGEESKENEVFETLNSPVPTISFKENMIDPLSNITLDKEMLPKAKNEHAISQTSPSLLVNTDTIVKEFPEKKKIFISKDTIVCENSMVRLRIGNAENILWNNGQTAEQILVNIVKSETFSVNFTNENGKDTTAYIFVRCVPCTEVTIPTAFTPNGDGLNDVFIAYVSGELTSFDLIVLSSNNAQIFRSSNPQKGWDGTYKGVQQPHGLYFYVVRYRDNFNQPIEKKGEFLLLRN
ncbi:MAG: gliding motility-associated C-terminal domain-containing protein [Bacteroidales bacterium]|jgi:gliding motility-associated-like protein|nr:gliding motility-associated C-terminal domain-containing protein [Bacteroidales bacterium]